MLPTIAIFLLLIGSLGLANGAALETTSVDALASPTPTIVDVQGPQAQDQQPASTMLSPAEQTAVVRGLSQVLRDSYPFPGKATQMAESLERYSTEALREPISARDLATRLTKKLYELSDDLHFFVDLDEAWVEEQRLSADPKRKQELLETERQREEQQNFFFNEVKILGGNVAYLSLTRFADPELGHRTLAAAMRFLSHCDAYIVDLRNNAGGALEMAQLLASYFLTSDSDQLLFTYYYMENGERIEREQRVLPSVPGERRLNAPLYVLVSSTSFSAAEWFAYVMGGIGRAHVIGEQTAGGAHPVDRKAIDRRFVVNVPIGEIQGPRGTGDFEGVGVQPEEPVAAVEALHVAHRRALEALMTQNPESRAALEWFLPVIDARRKPVTLSSRRVEAIVGDYEGRSISYQDGGLYYSWNGRTKVRLVPLSKTLFALEGIAGFRFRIIDADGTVTGLERAYADGRKSTVRRRTAPKGVGE